MRWYNIIILIILFLSFFVDLPVFLLPILINKKEKILFLFRPNSQYPLGFQRHAASWTTAVLASSQLKL